MRPVLYLYYDSDGGMTPFSGPRNSCPQRVHQENTPAQEILCSMAREVDKYVCCDEWSLAADHATRGN